MSAYELWRVEVDNRAIARDGFNRTASSGWGTADTGQAWTNTGGSASDYSVASGVGSISSGSVAVSRIVTAGDATTRDMQISATVTIPALALTNYIAPILMVRFTDANNYYYLFAKCQPDGLIDLTLAKVVAGVDTSITTVDNISIYGAGTRLKLVLQVNGTTLRGKVWRVDLVSEPYWQITASDTALAAGQFGIQNYLGTGNTNTSPVVITHDDVSVDYPSEHWVDITADVDTVRGVVGATSGQTAETAGDTGSMSLVLNNTGFQYTPGNAASVSALESGMPIRLFEVIGYDRIDHFQGFIEFPEIGEVNLSMNQDQTIQVYAVDQLSRWEQSQTFVSTLSAHIASDSTGTLRRYWPPIGHQSNYVDMIGSKTMVVKRSDAAGEAAFTSEDGPVAAADDFNAPLFEPGVNDISSYYLQSTDLGLAFDANQALTIVAWILPTASNQLSTDLINASILENAGSSALVVYETAAQLVANINFGALSGTINSGLHLPVDVQTPIAVQYGYSPSLFEFWVGRTRLTGTLSGSPPSTSSVIQLVMWQRFQGRIGHIQLHVGNAFTYTEYLAQYDVGTYGLERQSTGARIRTLAGYAGKTTAELDQVDDGASVMQRARLAGLTVADAMYEARDTEQGDLYIDGNGKLTFDDRRTLLNI